MKTQLDFKSQIKSIRKEGLEIGFSISTMDGYLKIWNNFIKWKKENVFAYNSDDYSNFLLEYYNFDTTTYTSKSKSRYQQLMRSKKILDNWDNYKKFMINRMLSNALYNDYPSNWNIILDNYLDYLKNVRCNSNNSIKLEKDYLVRLLSYFYQNNINNISDITKADVITFINKTINSGKISKRRNFYILRKFLNYLFIENILKTDLSIYIPTVRDKGRERIPTYLKQNEVEKLLQSIPKSKKNNIRDYAIILIAARLGLRQSDILNIKLKDIDWKNYKITVIQPKTHNVNVLPLSKEVGWAIIDYIKNARPTCNNEYLFVKNKYPYEKMEHFTQYQKYFEKSDIEVETFHNNGIHSLRHFTASSLLENGTPINIISSILGDSVNTTSKTYIKIDRKNLKLCGLEIDDNEL